MEWNMLDPFARQMYRAQLHRADALVDAFRSLPNTTLYKLASGNLSCGDDSKSWLERFQGTPLYDQAMELLQEELQQDAEELQNRQMQQAFYSAGDQLRLKKKLLELELARSQMEPPPPAPTTPATPEVPSAATPGPQGTATQPSQQPPEGAPPKTAEVAWMRSMTPLDEKRAEANFKKVALAPWVYGAVPGLFGGQLTGAAQGGLLSDAAASEAAGMGEDPTRAAKRSALGQMVGGGVAMPVGHVIGGTIGGRPGAYLGGLLAGHAGSGLGHHVVMEKYYRDKKKGESKDKEKEAAANFQAALEKMSGLGGALMNFARKNPGLAIGAAGGALVGGARGARQTIDPNTGQPVGGGITGALGGALGGAALGAGAGLATQGAARSLMGARTMQQRMAQAATKGTLKPGMKVPTYAEALKHQVGSRAKAFGRDVSGLGSELAASGRGLGEKMKNWDINAPPAAPAAT